MTNHLPMIPPDEDSKLDKTKKPLSVWQRSWTIKLIKHELFPVVFTVFGVILACAIVYVAVKSEQWWTKQIFISKVNIVKVAKAAELPEAPKVEPIKPSYSIKQVVDAVHILESSGGKNDGCKKKGLINGYGYAQHGSGKVWTCFDSHTEVRALVEKWYSKRIPELGLSTALCYYNTGYKLQECPYYQNFLKVVKS